MKYTSEIIINKPRQEVVELFDNTDNMKCWQKGLVTFEHIEGSPGEKGARSKLKYTMGKRNIEMVETILENKLPDEMHTSYDTTGVRNIQYNYFKEEGNNTKWISESEFKFSGFMKIMAFFMGSKAFKKQSYEFMDDFKAFAEGNPRYGN